MKLHSLKKIVMWYLHRPDRIKRYIENNKRNEERIRNKGKINVIFFASNISMWHYQGLYEEMVKCPRFTPYIVLSPLSSYTIEQKRKHINELRSFFDKKKTGYIDYDTDKMKGYNIKKLSPDILFYPQPYYTVMCKEHRYYKFNKCLLAYYPYFFHRTNLDFEYNEDFHNRAWRLYYETKFQKKDAKLRAAVGDLNVRIVGYPNADEFKKEPVDVWKPQKRKKKRIIWAPHFTISNDGWVQSGNFLWMADFIVQLAEEYKDTIQIAFKPHPRLLTELYKHPEWGKYKTDEYYKKWEKLDNGQLETNGYIDLFMTSDAMIHDSGSFGVEYQYTLKPVIFVSNDINAYLKTISEFGHKVYDLHYIAKSKEDILNFIDNIVIKGADVMYNKRCKFVNDYLFPPNNLSVAKNTMNDILRSLSPNQ